MLVKVSILGPDYLEEQLVGGPTPDPRLTYWAQQQYQNQTHNSEATAGSTETYQQEVTLAEHFEHSAEPIPEPGTQNPSPPPLTPSEALRLKHQHLHSISVLATQFGAKIVDVSDNSIIVEMSGKTNRVEAFLSLVKPFGIIESARTGTLAFTQEIRAPLMTCSGLMAMPRTPIARPAVDHAVAEEAAAVDASLLPPG